VTERTGLVARFRLGSDLEYWTVKVGDVRLFDELAVLLGLSQNRVPKRSVGSTPTTGTIYQLLVDA
jgi:hypothetical protein